MPNTSDFCLRGSSSACASLTRVGADAVTVIGAAGGGTGACTGAGAGAGTFCLRDNLRSRAVVFADASIASATCAGGGVASGGDTAGISAIAVGRSLSAGRSEEHTSELQSQSNLVCRLLLEKKKQKLRRLQY